MGVIRHPAMQQVRDVLWFSLNQLKTVVFIICQNHVNEAFSNMFVLVLQTYGKSLTYSIISTSLDKN